MPNSANIPYYFYERGGEMYFIWRRIGDKWDLLKVCTNEEDAKREVKEANIEMPIDNPID